MMRGASHVFALYSAGVNTSGKRHTLSFHPIYVGWRADILVAGTFPIRAIAQRSVTNNDDFFVVNASLLRRALLRSRPRLARNFARVIPTSSLHRDEFARSRFDKELVSESVGIYAVS